MNADPTAPLVAQQACSAAAGVPNAPAQQAARPARRRSLVWLGLLGASVVAMGLSSACLLLHENDEPPGAGIYRCVGCHGSASRPGPIEVQAAPPFDLDGNTDPSAPGVGAHERHVGPSSIRTPVSCAECHIVPADVSSVGHADSARPAEVVFGPLASLGGRTPRYERLVARCSQTYCHQSYEPLWTRPRPIACGSCHELPPPPPHDPSDHCSACHGSVIDERRAFHRPERHVNGVVDY